MSREYNEDIRYPGNKSRRNPKTAKQEGARQQAYREGGRQADGLKVMNDASVHPVPKRPGEHPAASRQQRASAQTAAAAAGAGGRTESRGRAESRGRTGSFAYRREADLARRRRRRIIGMIIAECFALMFIFGYAYVARLMNQVKRPEIDMEQVQNQDLDVVTMEKLKGYWTIAIFGVDARNNALERGTNSDVNIICNINLETGEIKLVSLFRDTYLNISKEGSYNKFNQAYFVGGPEQAMSAMNRNLDLNVSDYVTFNWKAVADAINILGGVDVELSKAEFYYINSFITETVEVTGIGSHHLKQAGMNHLDGVQAVAYGRLRLMDTDYARTERQRKVIKLAFEKAKSADFETLKRVLATVFPQIYTSLWVDDIYTSLININKYHLGDTMGFPEARGDANMGKKGACVIPQTLETNVVKLHQFLFGTEDYVPSETVQSISKKIAADTGMYKEGNYIKSVNTDGGVIQPPKTTAAETTKAKDKEEEDDDKYEYIYVLNSSGKKVKKRIPRETDSSGDYVKQETDEDGVATKWMLDEDGELVRRKSNAAQTSASESSLADRPGGHPTEASTDANGNPLESTRNLHPSESASESSAARPGPNATTSASDLRPSTHPTTPETDPSGRIYQSPGTSASGNNNTHTGPGGHLTTTEAANSSPMTIPSPGREETNAVSPGGGNHGPGSGQSSPGGESPGSGRPVDIGNPAPGSQNGSGSGVVAGPGQ